MRGMGNMQGMMKQMQKMQKKMMQAQEELAAQRFEGTAGGGMVKVIVIWTKRSARSRTRSISCRSR